jgi:hypothetical protein
VSPLVADFAAPRLDRPKSSPGACTKALCLDNIAANLIG